MPTDSSSPPSRSIPRRLFALALPVIGLNVLNVLALAVDTAMVGYLPDRDAALTGLGFGSQLTFLLIVAMMGLSIGATAFVARAHGAGKSERVEHILVQSVQLTVLLGLLIGGLGLVFVAPLLTLLGAEGEAHVKALAYLQPLLVGATFNYLNLLFGALLRGVGNTRLAFGVAVVSNLVNVAVNWVLILGHLGAPSLGVRGAAIGTVTSHVVAVVLMVFLLRRGAVPRLTVPLRIRRIDRALASELMRVGLPASLDMLVMNASFLSIVGMLGHLEQVAVAAHGVGLRVQALAFVPGMSISQATSAMVGNSLGAGDITEARSVTRSSVLLCTGIMSVLAVILLLGASPIIRIFQVEPTTRMGELSLMWMKQLAWCMPVVGAYIALLGLFRGAGNTRIGLGINLLGTFAIQIPASAILGLVLGWGPFGVWLGFPLSFAAKAVMATVAYFRVPWARAGLRAG